MKSRLPYVIAGAVGALAISAAPTLAQDAPCLFRGSQDEVAQRTSPPDSLTFELSGNTFKICYGRPSARGRTMLGGRLPHGALWRTGANEPTMIHASAPISIAGVNVPAGTYSIYTVPGASQWEIVVNRSYSQWGHEGQYTEAVQAQEAGRATVPAESTDEHVEMFTIHFADEHIVLEWENTRVRIPVATYTM